MDSCVGLANWFTHGGQLSPDGGRSSFGREGVGGPVVTTRSRLQTHAHLTMHVLELVLSAKAAEACAPQQMRASRMKASSVDYVLQTLLSQHRPLGCPTRQRPIRFHSCSAVSSAPTPQSAPLWPAPHSSSIPVSPAPSLATADQDHATLDATLSIHPLVPASTVNPFYACRPTQCTGRHRHVNCDGPSPGIGPGGHYHPCSGLVHLRVHLHGPQLPAAAGGRCLLRVAAGAAETKAATACRQGCWRDAACATQQQPAAGWWPCI